MKTQQMMLVLKWHDGTTEVISGFFLDPEDDTMSPAKAGLCTIRSRLKETVRDCRGLKSGLYRCRSDPF